MYKTIRIVIILILFFLPTSKLNGEEIGLPIEMLSWEKVNDMLPNKSIFTVMDVDTGKKFTVQRRAGNRHADVQPLTADDTKIMKEIYDGKWDWRRRAIIVMSENHWIAASMHGMPHGAGSLQNNFPGHFCIHFNGSKTHRSNNMDLSHKLMIYKAAGKLDAFHASAEPAEIVKSFIIGIKQRDQKIISTFSIQPMDWEKYFREIESIKLAAIDIEPGTDHHGFHLAFDVKIDWTTEDNEKINYDGKIHLVRLSPLDPWRVDNEQYIQDSDINE
ncbi:hypothetical protein ACFSKI_19570 [Pseudogracilibacillus auburnensis]|uniref:Uncharacterized protein n=1 Tax=Pseudogracilibacillus auburnensis TaxID=1494959 RepID=A0A2V3VWC8_9BACI|nr:hypothetical protein [Pseudogracilibacillus auburnensis]MBO1004578.1 hypothetical protein [Pseudogracilibacillus auburnensis]PXW85131.1 hypothetical protein DFR56_112109 [Pseudogracilibacillus auburnensis]